MALPLIRETPGEYKYYCKLPDEGIQRDGELSDVLTDLRARVEGHFMTPHLLRKMEQNGRVVTFTDEKNEFRLKAIGLVGSKGAIVTLTYPASYGELNGSPKLDNYGLKKVS